MKRKKIILIAGLVLALVNVFLVCWLFFGKKDGARNVIPADAKAVLVLDPEELASELDISILDILGGKASFSKGYSGVSTTQPCYGFISSEGYLCGVLALKSASTVQDAFEQYGLKVEKQRGLKWSYADNWLVCFDSDKLLSLGPVSAAEVGVVRGKMAEWMKQGEHSIPLLDKVDAKSPLNVVAQMDVLDSPFLGIHQFIPKDINLRDILFISSFSVKEKAISMDVSLQSDNAQANKFFDQADNVLRPIKGYLLNVGATRPFVWAGANVDGNDLLNLLRSNPSIRTMLLMLNMIVDADMMIKSLDGDLAIEVGDIVNKKLRLSLAAQIKDQKFLQNAKDWNSGLTKNFGINLSPLNPMEFVLEKGTDKYFFGVSHALFYVASDVMAASHVCHKNSYKELNPIKKNIRGSRFFVTANVDMLLQQMGDLPLGFHGNNPGFDRLNLSMKDSRHISVELTSKDKMPDMIKDLLK